MQCDSQSCLALWELLLHTAGETDECYASYAHCDGCHEITKKTNGHACDQCSIWFCKSCVFSSDDYCITEDSQHEWMCYECIKLYADKTIRDLKQDISSIQEVQKRIDTVHMNAHEGKRETTKLVHDLIVAHECSYECS